MCVDMSVYVYEQYEETGLFWREKGKKKKKHTHVHTCTHMKRTRKERRVDCVKRLCHRGHNQRSTL